MKYTYVLIFVLLLISIFGFMFVSNKQVHLPLTRQSGPNPSTTLSPFTIAEDGVYYMGSSQNKVKLEGADRRNFTYTGGIYGKDANQVFCCQGSACTTIAEAHVSSFRMLPGTGTYAMDQDQVYKDCQPLHGIDLASFQPLNGHYYQDAYGAYYDGTVLHTDLATFKVIDEEYAKDVKLVFYTGKVILKALPASFTVLSNGYAKDNLAVYYQGTPITAADQASFEVTSNGQAKDKNGSYVAGVRQ